MVTDAVEHTVYFHWPFSYEPAPDVLDKAWAEFMRRKESEGYRLGRVLRVWKTKEPVFNDAGEPVQEYNMSIMLHRPPRKVRVDVPDDVVETILRKVPGARLIE